MAQLAARLRPILLPLPGVARFLEAIGQGREARAALELEAEISRAVEAAFAEGAQFDTGVIRVIPVRDAGVVLSAEQLAHWRSSRGPAGLPDGFAQVWNAASNQRAIDSLAEIRRLWALGDDVS
jgi:hypothetical protein